MITVRLTKDEIHGLMAAVDLALLNRSEATRHCTQALRSKLTGASYVDEPKSVAELVLAYRRELDEPFATAFISCPD